MTRARRTLARSAEHPERIDVNYGQGIRSPRCFPRRTISTSSKTSATSAGPAPRPRRSTIRRLDARQQRGLQRRPRSDHDQRPRLQRNLDHRPQHDQDRGGRLQGAANTAKGAICSIAGAIRRLTAPAPMPTNGSFNSTTPTGFPRAAGRRQRAGVQQRRAPARRLVFFRG